MATEDEKRKVKGRPAGLPQLHQDEKGSSMAAEFTAGKDNPHDLPVSTPRLYLATSRQAYKQRAPIEKLPMKRWAVRHDPELWPTICPAK